MTDTMSHRPDPAAVVRWLTGIATQPDQAAAEFAIRIMSGEATVELPLVAWPYLDAIRRGRGPVRVDVLARLDADLDGWDCRFGLASGAPGPVSVAAQAWLVQDLHCLADLHNHVADGQGKSWSRRGHDTEHALHARLWNGTAYGDLLADGAWAAPTDCDGLMPLLLLDTPTERVRRLAKTALSMADVDSASRILASIGLERHGHHAVAAVLRHAG